nr:hypothetical protein [Dehalococcoidales bacterium]
AKLDQELAAGRDGVNTSLRAERAASRLLALGRAGEAADFYALAIQATEATGDSLRWGAGHLREKHGDALREAGDARGAACCYEAALETVGGAGEKRQELRAKAASARREAGDDHLARQHLKAAGDGADARVERALLALVEGDLERYRREAGFALEAQASAWRAHAVLARWREREGDRKEALRHLRLMLEGCPLMSTRHERQEALAALEPCGFSLAGTLAQAAPNR